MDEEWVIDATHVPPRGIFVPGTFCFIPVEHREDGDHYIVGMNYIGGKPPGKVVGVIHQDGEEAVRKFCEKYREELREFFEEPPQ